MLVWKDFARRDLKIDDPACSFRRELGAVGKEGLMFMGLAGFELGRVYSLTLLARGVWVTADSRSANERGHVLRENTARIYYRA
jgi:hypothetical protein